MNELQHTLEFIGRAKDNEESLIECLKLLVNKNPPTCDYVCKNADPVWQELSERYLSVKTQLRQLEELEEQYRKELIELANDNPCIGSGLVVRKIERKGTIDYKNIPELQNIDLENYRTAKTFSWRITIDEDI